MWKKTKAFRVLSIFLVMCMMFFAVSCAPFEDDNVNSGDPGSVEVTSDTPTNGSEEPGTQSPSVADEETDVFGDKGANTDPYREFYTFVPPVLSAPD